MGIARAIAALLGSLVALTNSGAADGHLELTCKGADWEMSLSGGFARFVFPQPTDLEIVLDTPAAGQSWPRALTLIGDRDTAILILDARTCGTAPYSAEVLTQRGQTPVFLVGCCGPRE